MKLSKTVKKALSFVLVFALTAAATAVVPAQKRADAASSYKAYLCMATGQWTFRNSHDDAKFSSELQNTTNKLSSSAGKAKFVDVKMKKSKKAKKYSVSLTGLKADVIGNDGTFNSLFVDTDIPGSMVKKVAVTNVSVFFDGKKVKTFKKGVLTPASGEEADFTQIQVINTWNDKVPKFKYSMPKKSIKVTYTIKFK